MESGNRAKMPATLAGIQFDVLLSQDETYEAQVPDYPVESGYRVQDGIFPEPLVVETVLYLTNTPVTWKSQIGESCTRVKTVEARLRNLFWDREPVTFITTDMTYENMVISSLKISKTEEAGYARRIPITLKQVEITETRTGVIPDSYIRGGQTEASAGTASVSSDGAGVSSSAPSGSSEEKENSKNKASMLYRAGKGLGLIK